VCVFLNATAGIEVISLLSAAANSCPLLCVRMLMASEKLLSISVCRLMPRGRQMKCSSRSARWWSPVPPSDPTLYTPTLCCPAGLSMKTLSFSPITSWPLPPAPAHSTPVVCMSHLQLVKTSLCFSHWHSAWLSHFASPTCIIPTSLSHQPQYMLPAAGLRLITVQRQPRPLLWLRACWMFHQWSWARFPCLLESGNVSVWSCSHAQHHAFYCNKHARLTV